MRVSIVTISFNQAQFLERTIRSVLDQDHQDIEYIIVDPGSTDGSRDIIERYRSRIAKTILEPDMGAADGLNKGFEVATGAIFAYVNSDDALLPGAVSGAVRHFERSPEVDVIYGNGYKVDGSGRVLRRTVATRHSPRIFAYSGVSLQQPSTFFRAEAFREVGGFNTENRTCWDGELLADMTIRGKNFRAVNEYWSVFTLHAGGISGSGRVVEQYRRDIARLFRKLTGHDRRSIDTLWFTLTWLEKYLGNPTLAFTTLADNVVGSPAQIEAALEVHSSRSR